MRIETASRKRIVRAWLMSASLAVLAAVVLPFIGSAHLDLSKALAGEPANATILFDLRIPRVLLAMLAGGALAVAGVLFQALLRDALATPDTLGVSSGAALGAVLAICLGWQEWIGLPAIWIAAFTGAGLTLLLVLRIASTSQRLASFTLLMTGVTVNSICLAFILFLHSMATVGQSFAIVHWLMGGIEPLPYSTLVWLGTAIALACGFLMAKSREWNLLALGEEWASTRGAAPKRLLLVGYLIASLITGSVTALTGPIGFVGLIIPHAIRMRLGADHRILLPCSFFLGAAFLAMCDTIARTILSPVEVPVGVITALIGGPCFILILRTKAA